MGEIGEKICLAGFLNRCLPDDLLQFLQSAVGNPSSHFRKQKSQIKRHGEQGSFTAYVVVA